MTADRAPEGLSEREVMDYAVTIAALLAGRIDGQQAVQTLTAQTDRILADRDARLAEQGAAIARVEALAEMWEGIHATIAPVLGEPPQGQVIAHAEQLRAALRPDPSAQGAGAEGVRT